MKLKPKQLKNFGILIDHRLEFREHVNFIEKQCAKFITFLYQTRQFLDENLLVKFFFTICSTSLPIWSINLRNHNQVDLNKVTKTTKFFSQNSLSIKESGRGPHDKKKARNSFNF